MINGAIPWRRCDRRRQMGCSTASRL